jgi:hypothetical protein
MNPLHELLPAMSRDQVACVRWKIGRARRGKIALPLQPGSSIDRTVEPDVADAERLTQHRRACSARQFSCPRIGFRDAVGGVIQTRNLDNGRALLIITGT